MHGFIRFATIMGGTTVLFIVIILAATRAQESPTPFMIFASSEVDFVYNIYRANNDGTQLQVLAEDIEPGTIVLPPNGQWIAYATRDGSAVQLNRMRSDGSGQQQIAEIFGTIRNPVWSPDGQWIAFVVTEAYSTSEVGLYRVRYDGTNFLKLTSAVTYHTGYPYGLHWSPDSEWITFSKALDHHASFAELYRIRWDGTDEQLLKNDERTFDAIWLSDEWLLVTRQWFDEYGIGMAGLFRMRPDGTNLQPLTENLEVAMSPVLSPDGRWIAFYGYRDEQGDLYKMRPDGSELQQLTDSESTEYLLQWLPDGWIIFSIWDYDTERIHHFRIQSDGTGLQPINTPDSRLYNLQWSSSIDLDWQPIFVGAGGILLMVGAVAVSFWQRM